MCLTSVPLEETIWLLTDKAFTNNWFNETYQLNLSRQDLVDLLTATKDQLFIFNGQLFEQTLSLWDPHLALYLLTCLCIALKKDWSKKARCPHTTGDLLMTHWPLCQHYNLCCTWSVWRITAWSRLVVTMATLGGIQSESSKDNRAIVLAGHMTWFAWSTSAFWHVTSNSQSKSSKGHRPQDPDAHAQTPQLFPKSPEVTWQRDRKSMKYHTILVTNHILLVSWDLENHALVTSGTYTTSWWRHALHYLQVQ